MKILSLHCDYIKFKPLKKALRQPEELSERRQGEIVVDNPLVLMIAVEKQDESNPDLIKRLIKEVKELAKQVKVDKLVLYPYAHPRGDAFHHAKASKGTSCIMRLVLKKLRCRVMDAMSNILTKNLCPRGTTG